MFQFTAKNTAISPNFLVWKFCGKSQFPQFSLRGNCAFPENFRTRKLGEITIFHAVVVVFNKPDFSTNPVELAIIHRKVSLL